MQFLINSKNNMSGYLTKDEALEEKYKQDIRDRMYPVYNDIENALTVMRDKYRMVFKPETRTCCVVQGTSIIVQEDYKGIASFLANKYDKEVFNLKMPTSYTIHCNGKIYNIPKYEVDLYLNCIEKYIRAVSICAYGIPDYLYDGKTHFDMTKEEYARTLRVESKGYIKCMETLNSFKDIIARFFYSAEESYKESKIIWMAKKNNHDFYLQGRSSADLYKLWYNLIKFSTLGDSTERRVTVHYGTQEGLMLLDIFKKFYLLVQEYNKLVSTTEYEPDKPTTLECTEPSYLHTLALKDSEVADTKAFNMDSVKEISRGILSSFKSRIGR